MDTSDVMRAMAIRLNQVPGLTGGAHYPKPNTLPPSPCVVITEGGATSPPSPIDRSTSEGQSWRPLITVHILVAYKEDTPREESRIDTLIAPVVDAFDPVSWGGVINDALPSLPGHLDTLEVRNVARGATTYAGEQCYVAMVQFEAQFHRHPNLIPLGGTP